MSTSKNKILPKTDGESSTSCSCSWCERAEKEKINKTNNIRRPLKRSNIAKAQSEIEAKCCLPCLNNNTKHNNFHDAFCLQYPPFNCIKTVRGKKEDDQKIPSSNDTNNHNPRNSTVPFIIVLEERLSTLKIEDGETSSNVSSNNDVRQRKRIFQKVESLYSGIRSRTTTIATSTTTTSMSADNSIQQSGVTLINNISYDLSEDITTIPDEYDDKAGFVTSSVSSISSPSFDDLSFEHMDYFDDDPLKILDILQGDEINPITQHKQKINFSSLKHEGCVNEVNSRLSTSFDHKEFNDKEEKLHLDVFIKDSLLSYHDQKSLDIIDGVSYDEEEVSLDVKNLEEHDFSADGEADLDNLCQESIYSNSAKSFQSKTDYLSA